VLHCKSIDVSEKHSGSDPENEGACSSETFADFQRSTRRYIPGEVTPATYEEFGPYIQEQIYKPIFHIENLSWLCDCASVLTLRREERYCMFIFNLKIAFKSA
jgi:hypothetical protein